MHLHKYEKIWLIFGISTLLIFLSILGVSASHMGHEPPSSLTHIDPEKVNQTPPFNKPGVRKVGENQYEVVIVASAFSYMPNQIEVPKGADVTFKVATKDVIHGFEVAGTNTNMMIEPGYVSEFKQTFDQTGEFVVLCNEYCGVGHHMMTARVKVVD